MPHPLAFSPSLCANPPALLPPVCERVCACVSSPWFRSFPFVCFLPVLSVVHRYAYARTHTREHVYACTCISLRPHPTLRTRNFSYTSSKKTRRHLFLSLFGCCLPPHPNPHPLSVPAYPASSVSTHNSLLSSSTFSGAPTAPSHMSSLCARVRAWYIGAEGEEEGVRECVRRVPSFRIFRSFSLPTLFLASAPPPWPLFLVVVASPLWRHGPLPALLSPLPFCRGPHLWAFRRAHHAHHRCGQARVKACRHMHTYTSVYAHKVGGLAFFF